MHGTRPVDGGADGWLLLLGRRVRCLAGQDMSFADVLELIISVALLVYLTIALVRPEWF
jgi:K+-transporting ATPase KdpF subunit